MDEDAWLMVCSFRLAGFRSIGFQKEAVHDGGLIHAAESVVAADMPNDDYPTNAAVEGEEKPGSMTRAEPKPLVSLLLAAVH